MCKKGSISITTKHNISVCAVLHLQTYNCLMCSSTFTGKEQLRLHIVSHTGDMPHKVPPPTPNPHLAKIDNTKLYQIF